MYQETWEITSVLTVFVATIAWWDRASSQMTCLKVVTEENPKEEVNGSESSVAMLSTSLHVVGMTVLIAAAWVAL
ncbi:hypothetical protein BDV24DRAFT_126123 [Aspergillus arachidicola]|uniref:Uncharacterized protein n=1 Tax=Aspergillus arachidicola TaxID=656916 RepID=A0A5N6YJC6_9EURO|nr:hypothetical protein BDV24DRAFT_126123 [Aspergillus arachidicola]